MRGGDSNLVQDIWSRIADIPPHLLQHADVVVAVQQHILLPSVRTTCGDLMCLKTRLRKHYNEPLAALIICRDWDGLLSCQCR